MFEWIDGHMILVVLLCPPVAWVAVARTNAWLEKRHIRQRAEILARRGA